MTNQQSRWALDKRVPVTWLAAIIFSIFVQSGIFLYAWASWKADMTTWRHSVDKQIATLAIEHPLSRRDLAVLTERVSSNERAHAELKIDIVRRLERQDTKLDLIATRLDQLSSR